MRGEVWQRFGSINGTSTNHRCIRTDWVKSHDFSPLPAKAWKETLRDGLNDIHLYEAAAKAKVRQQIHARFKDESKRKEYFGKLKYEQWVNDPLLCRWMRKVKKHGKNHTHNQIVLESGVYTQFKGKNGCTWLKIPSLVRGKRIAIPLNTNADLRGTLRLIIKDDADANGAYNILRKSNPKFTFGNLVSKVSEGILDWLHPYTRLKIY